MSQWNNVVYALLPYLYSNKVMRHLRLTLWIKLNMIRSFLFYFGGFGTREINLFYIFINFIYFFGQIQISEKKDMNDITTPTSSIKNPESGWKLKDSQAQSPILFLVQFSPGWFKWSRQRPNFKFGLPPPNISKHINISIVKPWPQTLSPQTPKPPKS